VPNPLYVLEVVIGFALVIFIHELGHFLAAKWCGVHVRKFAIGFGPPIVKWQPGETEYSLRPVPLGGFVDLAGEHPDADEENDPRALWRRPAWQRVLVFSAGVLMNAVLALVLFTTAPIVGMQVPAPVVGEVAPGSPAERAGLQPGDRIVAIDGEEMHSFEDVQLEVALSDPGTTFAVTVDRPTAEGGPSQRLTLDVTSRKAEDDPMPVIGIRPELEPVVADLDKRSVAAQAGLEAGDRILAVNGTPVHTFRGLQETLEEIPAGPLTLTIQRDGRKQDLPVAPSRTVVYEFGMLPPVLVVSVVEGSPAEEAGIKVGDRILAIEGKPWPTQETILETVESVGEGNPVRLTLWRKESGFLGFGGKVKELEVTAVPRMLEGSEKPKIGVAMGPAAGEPIQIGHVEPDGAAAEAGLQPGDVIVGVGKDKTEPGDWNDLLKSLWDEKGKAVPIQILRDGKMLTKTLTPKAVPQDRLTMADRVVPTRLPQSATDTSRPRGVEGRRRAGSHCAGVVRDSLARRGDLPPVLGDDLGLPGVHQLPATPAVRRGTRALCAHREGQGRPHQPQAPALDLERWMGGPAHPVHSDYLSGYHEVGWGLVTASSAAHAASSRPSPMRRRARPSARTCASAIGTAAPGGGAR